MIRKSVVKSMSGLIVTILIGSSPLKAQDLSETFKLALENDPTLKQVHANQLAIDESKDQSIARFLPTLSSTGNAGRSYIHNTNPNSLLQSQQFWNNSISVDLNQPLFHWDHWIQLSQSDNQIAQAEAAYKAELQNLMVKTTEAYFNVLSAQDNLEFTSAEKQSIYRQLEQAKRLFENGLISITDVHEAQAGYEQASANEIEAANQVDDQKELLREIIGDNDVRLDTLAENFSLTKPEPTDMSAWSKTAEVNNFNIISAFNQAEVSRKAIELQRNGHFPTLDVVGSYALSDVGSNFGIQGDRQSIGLQLNIPIFEGGAVNSKTRQASYQYEAAKENLNAVKRTIKRQVKDAYRGVITSINHIEALKATVVSAENALKSTEAGFQEGTRTMVDVLNEQGNLYQVKRDFSRARYDYFINSVKLKQASSNLSQNDLEQINRLLEKNTAN